MNIPLKIAIASLLLCLSYPLPGMAQSNGGSDRPLQVAIKASPPFIMIAEDGAVTGISIELWRQIATDLNLQCEYHTTDLSGLLTGLESGRFDVGVAPLTMTAEREAKIDFSHSYFSTGLGIVVSSKGSGSWLAAARRVLSSQFLQVIIALIFLLLIVGFIVWLVERRRNPEMFGGSAVHGIGAGFWWSAVTMTTVGYGDKVPVTIGGRILGLIWMFAALTIISSFTAAITSALTVTQLESHITGPEDLHHVRVATVENSAAAEYLRDNGLRFRAAASPEDALDRLIAGESDAVVYDVPIMKYLINHNYRGRLRILPGHFVAQNYAFGFVADFPLTEKVNRALLRVTGEQKWEQILDTYLGE